MTLALLVPGPIDQLTGGYLFARHVVDGLARQGIPIDVVELPGRFPNADSTARAASAAALARLRGDAVIDGLALAGFEACLADAAERLRLIAWVHHPLADETGLSTEEAARYRALETRLLPLFRGVICPSRSTAAAVAAYGVPRARIAVAPPGTARPARPAPRGIATGRLRLLSVASVTPRKGHLVLIEALARLGRADWELRCIGGLTRDPAYVAALRRAIAAHGVEARVSLVDEMPHEAVAQAYEAADLFVLPTFHEGYGMALAEALAHGLPVVTTRGGAVAETVPEKAGLFVEPGDAVALAAALARLLDDRNLLNRLAESARIAGLALPEWDHAVAHWRHEIDRLLS